MKAIRKDSEIQWDIFSNCHDGVGDVACKSLIEGLDSTKFRFIHYDEIKAGASIGEHEHTDTEEAYFLLSGKGVLIFDNEKYEMAPGDIVQLSFDGLSYQHTPVVVAVTPSDILVAAHSYDADYRPLSTYEYQRAKFLHVTGVWKA